jgi:hypothetical protein
MSCMRERGREGADLFSEVVDNSGDGVRGIIMLEWAMVDQD